MLIGLTLDFELITRKGEEITPIGLDNSGIISETGSIIKLYCYYIIGKDWDGCGRFKQVLNMVFSCNCSTFKLSSFSNKYLPLKCSQQHDTHPLFPKTGQLKVSDVLVLSMVELLFFPLHRDVASTLY